MAVLWITPESPFVQKLEWLTDIIRSRDGQEQRIAARRYPRQSFTFSIVATSDAQMQALRSDLFRHAGSSFQLPLWHEAVRVTSDVAAAATEVDARLDYLDDALGPDFLLLAPDDTYEVVTVSSRTATTVTLSAGVQEAYPAGSLLVPIEVVLTTEGVRYVRSPTTRCRSHC